MTKSKQETEQLGQLFAQAVLSLEPPPGGSVIFRLEGDLGGGKTTFVQGLARGLGVAGPVLSPTFVLLKRYPIRSRYYNNFYHFDCYRLEKVPPKRIKCLGWFEVFKRPRSIMALEWGDRLGQRQPKGVRIVFSHQDENSRRIEIDAVCFEELIKKVKHGQSIKS